MKKETLNGIYPVFKEPEIFSCCNATILARIGYNIQKTKVRLQKKMPFEMIAEFGSDYIRHEVENLRNPIIYYKLPIKGEFLNVVVEETWLRVFEK